MPQHIIRSVTYYTIRHRYRINVLGMDYVLNSFSCGAVAAWVCRSEQRVVGLKRLYHQKAGAQLSGSLLILHERVVGRCHAWVDGWISIRSFHLLAASAAECEEHLEEMLGRSRQYTVRNCCACIHTRGYPSVVVCGV